MNEQRITIFETVVTPPAPSVLTVIALDRKVQQLRKRECLVARSKREGRARKADPIHALVFGPAYFEIIHLEVNHMIAFIWAVVLFSTAEFGALLANKRKEIGENLVGLALWLALSSWGVYLLAR